MSIKSLYTLALGLLVSIPSVASPKGFDLTTYHAEITELSIDDNLLSPEIPKKYVEPAREAMKSIGARMRNAGLTTDLSERNGLVLMVTVAAADMFEANSTDLSSKADKVLKLLLQYMRTPDKYKVLIAVHSDDTGSEEYLNDMTSQRADAILQWFAGQGLPTDGIITYGLGYDEPLTTKPGRKERAKNRRVEFYFVPGPVMIEQLKARR